MSKAEMRVKQYKLLSGNVEKAWERVRENLEKSCLMAESIFNYTGVIKMVKVSQKGDLYFPQNAGSLIYTL